MLLLAVTWKLWTPQTIFPQIPFFGKLVETPATVDWVALAILLVGLLGMLFSTSRSGLRIFSAIFAVSGISLVLLDQHRMQPWAYQFLVFAILIACLNTRSTLFWMRWIVISIYLFSAISKFDFQFTHTVGDQMLSTLVEFGGWDSSAWSAETRARLIVAFPLGELLVGLGLAIPITRRAGMAAAIALHVTLLLVLGPFGMGHRPGVLIWNLFFIAQTILLFGGDSSLDSSSGEPARQSSAAGFAGALVAIIVILFPATRMIGICDHWPAWEVYAPRSSRAEIESSEDLGLPTPSTDQGTPWDNEPWLDMPQWSLSRLGVPIYPQGRFQLAVAMAVEQKFNLDRGFQVSLKSESNRRTGARSTEELRGHDQLQMRASRYWLNTKARNIWFDD